MWDLSSTEILIGGDRGNDPKYDDPLHCHEELLYLCATLSARRNLHSILIHKLLLSDEAFHLLVTALKGTVTVEFLGITDCFLKDRHVQQLISVLDNDNTCIEKLALRGNLITDIGVAILAEVLGRTRVTHLGLAYNNITEQGVRQLASCVLSDNTNLVYVDLRGLSNYGAEAVSQCLRLARTGVSKNIDRFLLDTIVKSPATMSLCSDGVQNGHGVREYDLGPIFRHGNKLRDNFLRSVDENHAQYRDILATLWQQQDGNGDVDSCRVADNIQTLRHQLNEFSDQLRFTVEQVHITKTRMIAEHVRNLSKLESEHAAEVKQWNAKIDDTRSKLQAALSDLSGWKQSMKNKPFATWTDDDVHTMLACLGIPTSVADGIGQWSDLAHLTDIGLCASLTGLEHTLGLAQKLSRACQNVLDGKEFDARPTGMPYEAAFTITVDDIETWLREREFYEFVDCFRKHRIDGMAMYELPETLLISVLGLAKISLPNTLKFKAERFEWLVRIECESASLAYATFEDVGNSGAGGCLLMPFDD